VSHDNARQFGWGFIPLLPFGRSGIVFISLVAAGAFTFGRFGFIGLEFLTHWSLVLGGWSAGLTVLSAVWGAGIECVVWGMAVGRPLRIVPAGLSSEAARLLFGGAYVVLLGFCWLMYQEFQCFLVAMPLLGLLVFAVTVLFQVPIIKPFRDAGRDKIAFAVLFVLEAVMMFLDGQGMAIDHYRKGLVHFQKDHQAIFSIPSSSRANFFFDYGRKEVVLMTRDASDPVEIRRSLAHFKCQ
jgi:hypothetical protein